MFPISELARNQRAHSHAHPSQIGEGVQRPQSLAQPCPPPSQVCSPQPPGASLCHLALRRPHSLNPRAAVKSRASRKGRPSVCPSRGPPPEIQQRGLLLREALCTAVPRAPSLCSLPAPPHCRPSPGVCCVSRWLPAASWMPGFSLAGSKAGPCSEPASNRCFGAKERAVFRPPQRRDSGSGTLWSPSLPSRSPSPRGRGCGHRRGQYLSRTATPGSHTRGRSGWAQCSVPRRGSHGHRRLWRDGVGDRGSRRSCKHRAVFSPSGQPE